MISYNYYGLNDTGEVKEINEDAFNGIIHNNVLFLMVADGLADRTGFRVPR